MINTVLLISSLDMWCLAIISITISASIFAMLLYKKNKYLKQKLSGYSNNINNLKKHIEEEKKNTEMHREELLAQQEHMQELNLELEKLSLVASKTDTAIAIADHKGRFNYVNQGFINLFGYTLDELITKVGKDIFTVSKKMNIASLYNLEKTNKTSLNFTSKIKTASGKFKWVKTTLNLIYDENKKLSQYIMLVTDVSELKNINEQLRKLSLVASKTDNSVIIFNSNNKIDWVNDGFVKMYGYSKNDFEEIFGYSLAGFLKKDQKEDLLYELNNSNKTINYAASFSDRFGIPKWKQTSITPVTDDKDDSKTFIIVESDITAIKKAESDIQKEKDKADSLLLNILPEETAEELKSKGKATPRFYRSVSVLFADIQGFTKLAEDLTPEELVNDLQTYFSQFDDIVSKYYVEKIKTIGDAYLCVGGLPMRNKSHPFDAVLVGLELQRVIKKLGKEREIIGKQPLRLRVGIHTGPVVAGVVGKQKMAYDIWGDSVNIAKRIESACIPGMVNISAETYEHIKDYFECEYRGKILAKNKGHIDMYFVHKIKPEFAKNRDGITPNTHFMEMLAQL